jgi:surface antigen
MPSGINPTLGCSPLTGCQEKDYYLPGKGFWAPKQPMLNKAVVGAGMGSFAAAYLVKGRDPVTMAVAATIGLVVGYSVGDALDKTDTMYGTMLLNHTLTHNQNGVVNTYNNPNTNVSITAGPTKTLGTCREFITNIKINSLMKKVKGTACLEKGQWELRELYK